MTELGERLRADPLYRAIFDINTAVKLLIDPTDGRIVDANPAALELYGWPLEALRTMRISEINTLTADEVKAEMDDARTLRRRYFRFRHRTATGAVHAVEVHSGPVTLDGRELLLSIIHDVTERDLLEEHARRGQRLEAIGSLAGGVAHDFNTVVLSASRLLRNRLAADHPGARFLDDIDEASRRGAELTRQLLAFSRRQVMAPRPVCLAEIVARLAPLLERSLGTVHELKLAIADTPPVVADPAQIEQVVMNLVLNARDAMPAGGRIVLALGTSAGDPEAHVAPGAWVTLSVRDDGCGMDAATRGRIFEPFFTTKAEGVGMGLASVYGIVRQSGGHIAVTSAPRAGTTFTVFLPATAELPAAPPEPVPAAAPAVRRRILLVDDEAPVRSALGELLSALGHDVITACSFDEAIAAAAAQPVELVLTDVNMPGRSGVELAVALTGSRPALAVIVMSGDLRDQVLEPLPAHAVRLAKPFTLDELERALTAAITAAPAPLLR